MKESKIYLGDSVYCEIEYGQIKLTTENGVPTDPSNVIFLDTYSLEALLAHLVNNCSYSIDIEKLKRG